MTDLGEHSGFTESKAVHTPMRLTYSAEAGILITYPSARSTQAERQWLNLFIVSGQSLYS